MRTPDGRGSGYAIADVTDVAKLNTKALTQRAADKATGSLNAKAIEPGKYTVILEPAALMAGDDLSLLGGLMYGLNARSADEGRSFMTKKGGGNRKGEKLFDERINIYSDPMNAEVPGQAFDGDGLPARRMSWVEKGVVKNPVLLPLLGREKQGGPYPLPQRLYHGGRHAEHRRADKKHR